MPNPQSNQWIATLERPFASSGLRLTAMTEVVVGHLKHTKFMFFRRRYFAPRRGKE